MTAAARKVRLRRQPPKHVFVATDFSPGAAQAVARAGRLPLAAGGRISLVHVLPDDLPRSARKIMEKAAFRQLEEGAADLRRLMSSTGRSGVEVAAALCRGRSYVEIIRHARSVGSDLIVLGRHGRRGLRDIFIGSTAARVSRMAGVPVLVVGRKANRPYERVVIAVDLEDTSRAVVEAALCVSGPDVRAVTMLHAYHVPFEDLIFPNVSRTRMTGLRKECRQTAASGMSRLQSSLGDAGVLWRTRVVHGDARAAILMETIKRRADFVAVGTHGRSGLSHSLVGSVAESVIEAAACDVLVARPVRMSFELP